MSIVPKPTPKNRLLAALSPSDLALLDPHASARSFELREVLIEPHCPISEIYFPETGMISMVTPDHAEIGVIGREGLVGISVLLGVQSSPLKAMCQLPSSGTCIPAADLLSAASTSASLSRVMRRYIHTFMTQVASTAEVNGNYAVEQRLARWILMCRDRSETDELRLTHEFLAMMLGVRRPGVTIATHVLEGSGLIRARRGQITVRDLERLRDFANGSYGPSEAEYERVMALRDGQDGGGLRLG